MAGKEPAIDFDRTDPEALAPRYLPCKNSPIINHAIDQYGHVWWWSEDHEMWYLLDEEYLDEVWASTNDWKKRAARFLKVLPLYLRPGSPGEREAAFERLLSIAFAHKKAWSWYKSAIWEDEPFGFEAALFYNGATELFAWLLDKPPAYDGTIEEMLKADGEQWYAMREAVAQAGT